MENEPERAPGSESVAHRAASTKAIQGALVGIGAALPLVVLLYGYTVDDALITARVASHWSNGEGYRFNSYGPPVDAVTPLGFAPLLALLGAGSPLEMFERARLLGVMSWLLGAGLLGALLARSASLRARLPVLAVLATSAPLGAWASSGMETGFVTLLGCCALAKGAPGAFAAGLAAALRPELLPWAFVLSVGRSAFAVRGPEPRAVALSVGLALGPALAVAVVRQLVFGSPAPLSLMAKPSDLSHGLRYATSAFVLGGLPLLLLAPRAFSKSDGETRVLVISSLSHFGALLLAGGDWMALFRLVVPVLPSVAFAAARLAERSSSAALAVRSVLALAASLFVLVDTGLPARHVLRHRLTLIQDAIPALRGAESVAALDAGWVGVATDKPIVDLAGVTDPVIAALPGGHTSKRVPEPLLVGRRADTWVLLLAPDAGPEPEWRESRFARAVEQRLAAMPFAAEFEVTATLALGGTRQRYLVVKRRASAAVGLAAVHEEHVAVQPVRARLGQGQ
jgi:hypothetical protein